MFDPPPQSHNLQHPRVLYIGDDQIGYRQSSGAFVLESIYASYPSSQITQYAHASPGLTPRGTLIPLKNFSESPLATPIKVMIFGILATRKIFRRKSLVHLSTVPSDETSLISRIYANLLALADIAPVRLPRSTGRLLSKQNPQVIHVLIGDARSMQRAIKVSERLEIPIVPFITDDWPSTIFLNGELGGKARKRTLQFFDKILERSPVLLVAGEAMSREYSSRFHRQCFIAVPSVNPDDFSEQYLGHAGKRRLVTVGSPHIGRAELADNVAKFAQKRNWEVAVYPVGKISWLRLSSKVLVQEQLGPEEVPPALCKADAILFVESFDPGIAEYTRLSVSGKLSQLIAAARPILAIGPAGQGSMEELRLHADRAVLLHELDEASLAKAFDYLDANLEVAPRTIPEHFLVGRLQANVLQAFQSAITIWGKDFVKKPSI